jgi:hypothetical protein
MKRIIIFESDYEEDENSNVLREECSLMAIFGYKTRVITYCSGSTMIFHVDDVTDSELKVALMKHTGIDSDEEIEDEMLKSWVLTGDCDIDTRKITFA